MFSHCKRRDQAAITGAVGAFEFWSVVEALCVYAETAKQLIIQNFEGNRLACEGGGGGGGIPRSPDILGT